MIDQVTNEDLNISAGTANLSMSPSRSVSLRFDGGSIPGKEQLIVRYFDRFSWNSRWVAAHVMLSYLTGYWQIGGEDRTGLGYFNGLYVDYRASEATGATVSSALT